MTTLGRLRIQARADLLVYLRTPAALFFGALLPVIFLVMFVSIFGNQRDDDGVRVATYQLPGFIALAVVSSAFVGLVISLVTSRENGILKRVRATPAPTTVVLAGRVAVAMFVSIVVAGVLLVLGILVYDVSLPARRLPALLVTAVTGAAAFAALGFAFTRLVGGEDAAAAMTNVVVLPLYFISGVFVPTSQLPEGLRDVASVLPLQPFNDALFRCFDPRTSGAAVAWGDLAVVAAWGLVGALIAARTFEWVPRAER